MIRLLVKKLLDDMNFRSGKKTTLNKVSEETGISRATLNRIVNVHGFKTNTDAINALCQFFKCTPSELIEYTPDQKPGNDQESSQATDNKEK